MIHIMVKDDIRIEKEARSRRRARVKIPLSSVYETWVRPDGTVQKVVRAELVREAAAAALSPEPK